MRKRIRGQMLPETQAILEEIQEGTALHGRLALVVADLADAETKLGARQDDGGAVQYNMCEGDSYDGDWDTQGLGQQDDAGEDHQWEGPEDGQRSGRPAGWKPEGPGRWTRASNPGGGRQAQALRPNTEGMEDTQTSNGTPTTHGAEGCRATTGG